jgi:hypothetical protein
MMEAVRTFETSVNFNVTTRRYNPDDSKFQPLICLYLDKARELFHRLFTKLASLVACIY